MAGHKPRNAYDLARNEVFTYRERDPYSKTEIPREHLPRKALAFLRLRDDLDSDLLDLEDAYRFGRIERLDYSHAKTRLSKARNAANYRLTEVLRSELEPQRRGRRF